MEAPPRHSRIPPPLAEGALLAVQAAFLVWTRLFQPPVLLDDAHIHFKYALSWARGDGWVFNIGEHVLGTTSPVWTFILGISRRITGAEITSTATALNLAFDAVSVLLILIILRAASVGLVMRHAVALAVAAEPLRILNSVGGMEMSLFSMTVLLALAGLARDRWWIVAIALGPAGFIRPEGAVLWAACAGALLMKRDWHAAAKALGASAALALVIAGLVLAAFGSVIPNSLLAKSIAPWYTANGGICHTQFFAVLADLFPLNAVTGFQAVWSPMDWFNTSVVAVAQITVMAFGMIRLARGGVAAAGTGAGLFLFGWYLFYALANPGIFHWYYVPYFTVGLLLGGAGAAFAFEWLAGRASGQSPGARWPALLSPSFALLWLACSVYAFANREASGVLAGESAREALNLRLRGTRDGDREADYARLGRRMNAWITARPDTAVGCMEVGIFGCAFRGRVLDSYGLVSPEVLSLADPAALTALPESCRRHPVSIFMTHRPEFIMLPAFMFPNPPAEFLEAYQLLQIPDIGPLVFIRRDLCNEPWGFPAEYLESRPARRRD